jgi:hypothetical protein
MKIIQTSGDILWVDDEQVCHRKGSPARIYPNGNTHYISLGCKSKILYASPLGGFLGQPLRSSPPEDWITLDALRHLAVLNEKD